MSVLIVVQNSFTTLNPLCFAFFIPASPSSWSFCCFHSFALLQNVTDLEPRYVAFSQWLLSLGNTHLRFLVVFHEWYLIFSTRKIFHILSICCLDGLPFNYLPTEGHLGDFQVCAIMSQAAVTSCVGFVWTYVFSSFVLKYQELQLLDHMAWICLVL